MSPTKCKEENDAMLKRKHIKCSLSMVGKASEGNWQRAGSWSQEAKRQWTLTNCGIHQKMRSGWQDSGSRVKRKRQPAATNHHKLSSSPAAHQTDPRSTTSTNKTKAGLKVVTQCKTADNVLRLRSQNGNAYGKMRSF